MRVGPDELTTMVHKTEGPSLEQVRNLDTHGKSRGLSAWHRVMREAEWQVETNTCDQFERVPYSGRKVVAVNTNNAATTIEKVEGYIPEYTSLTGLVVDNTFMILNIKRMLP